MASHAPRQATTVRLQSAHDASHIRFTRPPCARPHVAAHPHALRHAILATITVIQQLARAAKSPCSRVLLWLALACPLHPVLARPSASCLRAHCAPHLRAPHHKPARPSAPHRLACCCVRLPARTCARCPALLAPMLQRGSCFRAPANVSAMPCFRAHHKRARLLPRLGTRPPSQATAVGLMTHGCDSYLACSEIQFATMSTLFFGGGGGILGIRGTHKAYRDEVSHSRLLAYERPLRSEWLLQSQQ